MTNMRYGLHQYRYFMSFQNICIWETFSIVKIKGWNSEHWCGQQGICKADPKSTYLTFSDLLISLTNITTCKVHLTYPTFSSISPISPISYIHLPYLPYLLWPSHLFDKHYHTQHIWTSPGIRTLSTRNFFAKKNITTEKVTFSSKITTSGPVLQRKAKRRCSSRK